MKRRRCGPLIRPRWREELRRFTAAQRDRYNEVLKGRKRSLRNREEAVDIVMREPAPGACCQRCYRKAMEEKANAEQQRKNSLS